MPQFRHKMSVRNARHNRALLSVDFQHTLQTPTRHNIEPARVWDLVLQTYLFLVRLLQIMTNQVRYNSPGC